MFTMTAITTRTALTALDFVASESKKITMLAERVGNSALADQSKQFRQQHLDAIERIEAGTQTDEDKTLVVAALGSAAAYHAQQSSLAERRGDLDLTERLDERQLACRTARAELAGNELPTVEASE